MNVDKERQILAFINNCQQPEDLLKLPLTHPQAYALFEYCRRNGNLESLDKLLEVSGIGKRTLEKVKDYASTSRQDGTAIEFWTRVYDQRKKELEQSVALSNSSSGISSWERNEDLTRKQAVWTAIIGYMVLYLPLYFLGKISYGWFIGCAVVGGILGLLVLFVALGSLLSGQKKTAVAALVMALSVIIALSTAFGDLPRLGIQNNESTKLSQSSAPVSPSVSSRSSGQDTGQKSSDRSKLQRALQGVISARLWGTVSSIELQPLDGGKFLLSIKWKLSDSVARQYWEFEYINLLIEWAQSIFTDKRYESIEIVQSQMLVHMVSIYGGNSWSLGIQASLSRKTANKVVDWHTFKVTLSQDSELFFDSVADNVILNL